MSMTVEEAIERVRYRISTAKKYVGCGLDGKAFEDLEMMVSFIEELEQYRAIGTVSEFRELKEKATAKHRCHNCGELLKGDYIFCPTCRRKIDWSEGKE